MKRWHKLARICRFAAYDQIRNAHREVYALYEIARTFGSSLEIENTLSVLVDKVGQIVPFDTCVVYLHDEVERLCHRRSRGGRKCRATCNPGASLQVKVSQGLPYQIGDRSTEFIPAWILSNLKLPLENAYRSMASLPLFKDELLLGALSVYSTSFKEYSDDQIRLLETVTRLASDALATQCIMPGQNQTR